MQTNKGSWRCVSPGTKEVSSISPVVRPTPSTATTPQPTARGSAHRALYPNPTTFASPPQRYGAFSPHPLVPRTHVPRRSKCVHKHRSRVDPPRWHQEIATPQPGSQAEQRDRRGPRRPGRAAGAAADRAKLVQRRPEPRGLGASARFCASRRGLAPVPRPVVRWSCSHPVLASREATGPQKDSI